jgi:hypothetical protein
MGMILDMSFVRKKSDDIYDSFIFELKMKGFKFSKEKVISILPAAGLVLISQKPEYDGIYSYEMINVMGSSGGLLNAIIFCAAPLLQEIKIHDLNMINTYIRSKLSA